MADLSSILTDPNYVNANEATKRAIFDRYSTQDPNYTGANAATQEAIRVKFGVAQLRAAERDAEEIPGPRGEPPRWAAEYPNLYKAAVTTREMLGPTVEMLGGVAGGAVGTVSATPGLGTLLGAGAGYAGAKQVLRLADQYLGVEPRLSPQDALEQATKDIASGATLEAGGRVVGQALGAGLSKLADIRQLPEQRAAQMARQSLGGDVTAAQATLRAAPEDLTAAQALAVPGAEGYRPTTQALLQRAAKRAPETFGPPTGPMAGMTPIQQQEAINTLAEMAGGSTATATRAAAEAAKNQLTEATRLGREMALTRANLGEEVARFEAQAGKLSAGAAAKVQEVRRLIDLGDHAAAAARLQEIKAGVPVGSRVAPAKTQPSSFSDAWAATFTYPGKLAQMSDEWAAKAANASLDLGQGARFNTAAAETLRAQGIKPLEGEKLVRSLEAIRRNPEFAGNDLIDGALQNVASDIAQWTKSNGIIDAKALDAIRMNSVNAAIAKLRPGADATSQRNMAAGVLTRIKPAIVDAIEDAGGVGYRQYLEDYAKGAQKIAEQKLTGEALRLWKTNRNEFVRLVMNEDPDTVEKFLGPGKYNIGMELAQSAVGKLGRIAETAERAGRATEQAGAGQTALQELLLDNLPKWRVPWGLSVQAAATNKALDTLERRLGRRTWEKLTAAAQTAKSFDELLSTLPASERVQALKILKDPAQYGLTKGATARGVVNALAPSNQPVNNLIESD